MKKRINWVDVAKGLAILLVIVGHSISKETIIWKIIFSFHMPLFFIISGFLYKDIPIKTLILKNSKRMLIPYFGTSIFILIIAFSSKLILNHTFLSMPENLNSLLVSVLYGTGVTFSNIWMIGAIWFLLCLFITELLFSILIKLINKYSLLTQSLFITIIAFVGYYIGQKIFLPWNIDIALISLTFFFIGHNFRKYQVFNKKNNSVILILCFIIWVLSVYIGSMDMAARFYSNFILNILGAISCCYLLIKIFNILSEYRLIKNFFSFYGKNTLVIFCFHLLELDFFPWPAIRMLIGYPNHVFILILNKIIFATLIVLSIKHIPIIRKIYYFDEYKL